MNVISDCANMMAEAADRKLPLPSFHLQNSAGYPGLRFLQHGLAAPLSAPGNTERSRSGGICFIQAMNRKERNDMTRNRINSPAASLAASAAEKGRNICGSLNAMGDVIRKYRKAAGLTQAELASELDVTRNAVITWESNRARPQMEMLLRISHLLAIPIAELFDVEMAPSGLTLSEHKIMEVYRQLTPEDQKVAARMMQVLLEEEENEKTRVLREDYRPVFTLATPAAAGPGCDYLDNTAVQVCFYRKNRRYERADLVCRVCGHSMEPYYRDGDYVYAKAAPTADDGSDVICDSNDGRMIKRKAGDRLLSLNPDPQYQLHKSEDDDVHIVAVVLGIVPEEDKVDPLIVPALEELHSGEIRRMSKELSQSV